MREVRVAPTAHPHDNDFLEVRVELLDFIDIDNQTLEKLGFTNCLTLLCIIQYLRPYLSESSDYDGPFT